MKRLFLLLPLLALLAPRADARNFKYPPLGKKTLAVLKGATKVEVFKLDEHDFKKKPLFAIGGQKRTILATGKPQGAKYAAKLVPILTALSTRDFSGASGFGPELGFRFTKGKETVDVMVDLDGMQYAIAAKDQKDKVLEGNMGGLFDVNAGPSTKLSKLAAEAFPKPKKK